MIDKKLAQQIVATVKDVSGRDINFINTSGIIFASTDEKRIDTFHEIGRQAADSGETIEVDTDTSYSGTQRGVNLPIRYKHAIIAVIGITGPPDEVRSYAYLAQRITNLLIRERELISFSHSQIEKKHYLINALLTNEHLDHSFLSASLSDFHLTLNDSIRVITIRLRSEYNPINLSMIEAKIHQLFRTADITLFTYYYPNEYLAVIGDTQLSQAARTVKQFSVSYDNILDVAIGKVSSVLQLSGSYESCRIALRSLEPSTDNFVVFDDLTLELVLSSVSDDSREAFLKKTLNPLTEEDLRLISIYFEENMSLQRTCERLFLHKNTVQYQLDRIHRICGYNPRRFKDAAILYLAVKLQ